MADTNEKTADQAIDGKALDSLSVAPDAPNMVDGEIAIHDPRQEAGQDTSIAERLERNPESKEARLDNALDESMDASDPPSSTQPVHSNEPAASSGYDEEEERRRQKEKTDG